MSKITGKVTIKIDGKVLAAENQATLDLGGTKRNPETHGGKTYFGEEESPALLEVSLLITKETDLMALNEMTGGTVFVEADTGQQFMMSGAFTTEPVSLDGGGKTPLKISCESLEQI